MPTYQITNSDGLEWTFDGDTPQEALEALARDRGYETYAERCADIGDSPSDWTTDAEDFDRYNFAMLVVEVVS